MQHKHIYDVKGKQLCCTQQGKIYTNAGASSLLEDGHSKKDGHNHSEHSDEDGHDHSKGNDSVVKMFLPTMISLCLLLIAIAFDKLFEEASLLLPMNIFCEPTVITLPASLPIALFELPVVKPDKL